MTTTMTSKCKSTAPIFPDKPPSIKQRRLALTNGTDTELSDPRKQSRRKSRLVHKSNISPRKMPPSQQINNSSSSSSDGHSPEQFVPSGLTMDDDQHLRLGVGETIDQFPFPPGNAILSPEYLLYYAQLQQQMAALATLSAFASVPASSPPAVAMSPHGPDSVSRETAPTINSPPPSEAGSMDTSTDSIATAAAIAGVAGSNKKNYKSLTRERRVEANARERTRVHTISAAFEALRRTIPSYTSSQKLSKLAILRIACRYIESLATLLDLNYSEGSEAPDFSTCVHELNETISTESKLRRN